MKYILKNKKAVICEDLLEWADWITNHKNRIINTTEIESSKVSTVFLGFEHGYNYDKPMLFETMIFGDDYELTERYTSWNEAAKGHKRHCRLEKARLKRENKL